MEAVYNEKDFDNYIQSFTEQFGAGKKVKYGVNWYGKVNGDDARFMCGHLQSKGHEKEGVAK